MNLSTENRANNNVKHSEPIPIGHSRSRSSSLSSDDSGSPSSPLQTPLNTNPPRIPSASPSSSPILSYFLSQSPTGKSPSATFPFKRGFGPPPVFEDEVQDEFPATAHARRASITGRFNPPSVDAERGAGLLRRLSLGGSFARVSNSASTDVARPRSPPIPAPPPNSAVTSVCENGLPATKRRTKGRSSTLSVSTAPHRAPSPMGERILKGHFDGFN